MDHKIKEAFDNFQVPPPTHNWEDIQEELNVEIDEEFKNKLQPLEVTPGQKNWDIIQRELPLHPGMRRYFSWISKIAAILLIGMLLAILSDQQKHSELSQGILDPASSTVHKENAIDTAESLLSKEENTAYVFEVEKSKSSIKDPRNFNKEEEKEMKNLLQFILDDEDEFAEIADMEVVNQSLTPAKALDENMAVAQTKVEEVIELEIKIPLIVVENAQEAENLIQIYDSSHKSVSQSPGIE